MPPTADPFTHRHEPPDMVRYDNGGSECRACGRRWYLWTAPNGHTMLLTEPRFENVRAKKGRAR